MGELVWPARNAHLSHMSTIANIATSALRAAETRFAARAENIANANSLGYTALQAEQISTAIGPVVRVSKPDKPRPNERQPSDVDLGREAAGLVTIKYDYKAAVKLLQTADALNGKLLDILA